MSSQNELPKVEIEGALGSGYWIRHPGEVIPIPADSPCPFCGSLTCSGMSCPAMDFEVGVNHSKEISPGLKYDAGKPSLSLIDSLSLEQMARVLDHGKYKYSAHNWRGGIQWSRSIDAAMRHIAAFNGGEDLDKESGLPHLAHAMVNCMFLLRFMQDRTSFDDRYKEPTNGHCVK